MTPRKPKKIAPSFLAALEKRMEGRAVDFPEIGQTVYVRPLSEAAAAKARPLWSHKDSTGGTKVDESAMTEILIAACTFDAAGNPIFSMEDAKSLPARMESLLYNRLAQAVLAVNGLTVDPQGNS